MIFLSLRGRRPITQALSIGGISLLVLLGWLTLAFIVFSKVRGNILWQFEIAPPEKFVFRDDFNGREDPDFWRNVPIVGHTETCMYPSFWQIHDGLLRLPIIEMPSFCNGAAKRFRGTIITSKKRYHPPFEVRARLRATDAHGVVSSLFTYTDPMDRNRHYENDFEFPGGDDVRTAAWLNYYSPNTDPAMGAYEYLELGFDATKGFNEYSITVLENATIWKANGKVIREHKHNDNPLPQRVVMNLWYAYDWWETYYKAEYKQGQVNFDVDWIEVEGL